MCKMFAATGTEHLGGRNRWVYKPTVRDLQAEFQAGAREWERMQAAD